MKHFFLICGYGVPKDILKDEHHRHYLGECFNFIFDAAVRSDSPIIIFSSGPTDCFKPYRHNEATELSRLFKIFMDREAVRQVTKKWKLLLDSKALSTLENLPRTSPPKADGAGFRSAPYIEKPPTLLAELHLIVLKGEG